MILSLLGTRSPCHRTQASRAAPIERSSVLSARSDPQLLDFSSQFLNLVLLLIEGVRNDRLNVFLFNAIKQQQPQIEELRRELQQFGIASPRKHRRDFNSGRPCTL